MRMRITVAATLAMLLSVVAVPSYAVSDDKSIVWGGCGITKKAFMAELAKAYEKKTGIKITLNGGGATKGIRDAAKGDIDIGGACRTVIDSSAKERSAYQVPVAWDAIAVIVHPDNPVESISVAQLKQLYTGKIKNWNQLGGPNVPIELYIRRGKISGVGRTLRELVFANYNQEFVSSHIMRSTGPLEKAIEKDRFGIGATGISSAKRRNVKLLKLNGKDPSYDNIKKGDYALYRPLYLVTQGRASADKKVKDFITFALSREGREIIRKAGTVPYADAIGLVMKQVEQYDSATQKGLYSTTTN